VEWCDDILCEKDGKEVTSLEVMPKVGNAVFWRNMLKNGTVDDGTLHAGTPVTSGTKIGLNIWTREKPYRW
jgi:prolyl 4-hydroxylase